MTLIEELREETIGLCHSNAYHPLAQYAYLDGLERAIEIAEHHSDWTPVSQPPKYSCDCSITVEWIDDLTGKRYRKTMQSHYDADGNYFYSADNLTVIAWQPLPKPYEGD